MTSPAARFAAVYAALTASHEVADYWVQNDAQATAKGQAGRDGVTACVKHVVTYTAVQALALTVTSRTLNLRLTPGRAALALTVSAVTHYVADRQSGHWGDEQPRGIVRLAAIPAKEWLRRDPGAGPLLDQSWHKGWIAGAALLAAGGAR
ncbi:hypothetical protein [Actinacidiphila acididurans]|uniref:DUF3307 domain-containing protein n=1 Tax=Actinacidiphila acididurans TaxID=2784346 RepID=A0ABS2TQM9_9ACTN|nr:hypothetical protein [Actinacidiphila acididurans]MBM9504821.1 hypothetical protein [Actinacidiphila acididurans]